MLVRDTRGRQARERTGTRVALAPFGRMGEEGSKRMG